VRLGRVRTLPDELVGRVVAKRAAGSTLHAIADRANREGIPTGQGGQTWRPSSVAAVLRSAERKPVGP
jgi:hypothetical protein